MKLRPETRRKLRRGALASAVASVLALALLEAAARALTGECNNGMPCFGRVPLLPLRPPAELVERELAKSSAPSYVVPDAQLGWTIGAEARSGEGDAVYGSNRQGLRADPARVYGPDPPPGKIRIVTVGDSFTHGDEVSNEGTWQTALEAGDERLEVLNLGVPGYGTDQALLRWRRDGRSFRAHAVILGIWPENMCRNLNVFRYYLVPGEGFACKPRMLAHDGALELVHSPVSERGELVATLSDPGGRELLAHERWYRPQETEPKPWESLRLLRVAESVLCMRERKQERARLYSGEDPEGIRVTTAIAVEFAREVRAEGATPLVLVIPMRDLLPQHAASTPFPLVRALREAGLDVLDLGPALAREAAERGEEVLYTPHGHHTVEGNRALARELLRELAPRLEVAQR